jgi:hypothetical protein
MLNNLKNDKMEFLKEVKNLKRGNRPVFTAEDLITIEKFEVLNADEFMEQKEITRLGKLLDRAVLLVVPARVQGINVSTYIHTFRTGRLVQELKAYLDSTYEYYQFKYKQATEEQMAYINELTRVGNLLSPISDKFKQVSEKQWMRNGKVPKTLQKEAPIENVIRGKLCAELEVLVLDIAEKFEAKQTAYYAEIKTSGCLIANVTARAIRTNRNGKIEVTLEELADEEKDRNIDFIISSTKTALISRLVKKLGGFDLKSKIAKTSANVRSHNSFNIFMAMENGDSFEMIGKSVLNHSPLGTPFIQFPITFHNIMSGGNKVENSEYNFKKAFSI